MTNTKRKLVTRSFKSRETHTPLSNHSAVVMADAPPSSSLSQVDTNKLVERKLWRPPLIQF